MREIVVSMQNTLLSEAVARSLAETGEFRVEQVLPGKTGDTFSLCRAAQADILLMEVSRLPAYTLENRPQSGGVYSSAAGTDACAGEL